MNSVDFMQGDSSDQSLPHSQSRPQAPGPPGSKFSVIYFKNIIGCSLKGGKRRVCNWGSSITILCQIKLQFFSLENLVSC